MTPERPNEAASTTDFEFAALREAGNYRAALVEEFSNFLKGRVLEIGAGVGQITAALREIPAITRLVCIEPGPEHCRAFRAALPGQELIEGTREAVAPGMLWDAILSVNVLEHIRDDELELAACRQLLAPTRGHLCLFVPARPEIYAPIDRDFGHHRRYARPALRAQLARVGFDIVRLDYFNCVGYAAWWFTFCLRRQRSFNARAVRLYDRVIFPPVHWTESHVCRPPIGQSLLAVARARA
ncbi:MAG: class I SAM-dependent methyltransferase [Planctomycetes bacterium]|nr:class I SAM-dependent methyltransferase [Planctomycetota bacterium]